jgi:hypothetical protein
MPFYRDGKTRIKIGERVLWDKSPGKIVFVFDDGQFSPEYPKERYEEIIAVNEGKGVGVRLEKSGEVFIDKPVNDIDELTQLAE